MNKKIYNVFNDYEDRYLFLKEDVKRFKILFDDYGLKFKVKRISHIQESVKYGKIIFIITLKMSPKHYSLISISTKLKTTKKQPHSKYIDIRSI